VANPWDEIWRDQRQYNALIRPEPSTHEEKSEVTSELALALFSEVNELLGTTKWKKHRRPRRYQPNLAHTTEELVDVFKDFIGLCQVWDVTPDDLIKGYWAKSAVVRQRYSEEWVKHNISGPVILIDLDNVLCDYVQGFGEYLLHSLAKSPWADRHFNAVADRVRRGEWIGRECMPGNEDWFDSVKHEFRTSGGKRDLPLMEYAVKFAKWCHELATTILLTARPIDQYPNMLTDTVLWLNKHDIPRDHIWWGADKGKVVESQEIREHVLFAVDDQYRHCEEYARYHIKSYWLAPDADPFAKATEFIHPVKSLNDIIKREG